MPTFPRRLLPPLLRAVIARLDGGKNQKTASFVTQEIHQNFERPQYNWHKGNVAPVNNTPWPRFTPGERAPGTDCPEGWVGPTAGLDAEA
jgi:nucleoid DNA-binding protein